MNFKSLKFLILALLPLFIVAGCQKKFSDEEYSYSNIKVIARCIQESKQKYETLYDYYKNDDIEDILMLVSPFASPDDKGLANHFVSENTEQARKKLSIYKITFENFAIICGYEYFWDKSKNEIVINDRFKKDIKMTMKL